MYALCQEVSEMKKESNKGFVKVENEEVWEKTPTFGEFMMVEFEMVKENMEQLKTLFDGYSDSLWNSPESIDSVTRSFIALAKECEITGTTLFIPFSKAVNAPFPVLQYLNWLQRK